MNDFRVSTPIVWVLAVTQVCVSVYGMYLFKLHTPYSTEFAIMCSILTLFIQVIFISDIYLSRIQNKTFWIISIFILSGIAEIIYLIRRNKLHNQSQPVH